MDCDEIASTSLEVLQSEILRGKTSAFEAQRVSYELFRTIFQIQFESRGLIIDFDLIQALSNQCVSELFSKHNWSHFKLSPGTTNKVDMALHNWTCKSCGNRVLGESHSMIECRQVLIDSVLSS